MDPAVAWRSLFEGWPDAIPREGMLVTALNESIPFTGFMVSGGLLVIARDKPDQYGTRKVILPYGQIAAIRLSTTIELQRFASMGFQPPM